MTRRAAMARLRAWFGTQGWRPLRFQQEVWRRYLAGESGLLHTPTGSGKTLAAFGGPLLEALAALPDNAPAVQKRSTRSRRRETPLKVLWITPLRALATDTVRALREPLQALGLDWEVGARTGDASSRDKRLAREGKLDVLVTTPESLALLLSYPDTAPRLGQLRAVIVDEWHELLGSKRGVLLQLNLARLRGLSPSLRTWGLSATLGNLAQARDALLPPQTAAAVVAGVKPRAMTLETLLPATGERFPWAGHLGLSQLQRVLQKLMSVSTSLLFTNTRSQAELWHQALQSVWPEAPETLGLHHGSLDPGLRLAAETGLRDGTLRCVVATSSLDLGVDFPAVDQVLQVGSPKGVATLAATGRPRAPSPRRVRPHRVRALACTGTGRIRRGPTRDCARTHRVAHAATPVHGCTGPALRQLRAGRRIHRRRAAGRSPADRCLRRPGWPMLAGGARLHRARRASAFAVPRLPQGGA